MRLKIQKLEAGLHPNEAVASIRTSTGIEWLVVDKRSILKNSLSVGSPVAEKNEFWLVELPRETTTGSWRVWVKKDSLIPENRKSTCSVILTDREIKIALARGLIEIDPEPDEAVAFSSTAVDLTLDDSVTVFNAPIPGVEKVIDPTKPGFNLNETIKALTATQKIAAAGFDLRPGTLVLAWTKEYVRLATETRIAARVEGKSSLARLGLAVHMTAPTIHAGFSGQIQLEMINHGSVPVRLKPDMRICQLIFETTLGTPERGYMGQFAGQRALRKNTRKSKRAA